MHTPAHTNIYPNTHPILSYSSLQRPHSPGFPSYVLRPSFSSEILALRTIRSFFGQFTFHYHTKSFSSSFVKALHPFPIMPFLLLFFTPFLAFRTPHLLRHIIRYGLTCFFFILCESFVRFLVLFYSNSVFFSSSLRGSFQRFTSSVRSKLNS